MLYIGCFFFQAEDGIRDLVRSRGLGDVYKRQAQHFDYPIMKTGRLEDYADAVIRRHGKELPVVEKEVTDWCCLLYTSDAADERSSVDLGGRRIIKKKNN